MMMHARMYLAWLAVLYATGSATAAASSSPSPDEVRVIAQEAYVIGFPLVDNYRLFYPYFHNASDPSFTSLSTAPAKNVGRTIIAIELLAEPLVFTAPDAIEGLAYSVQLVDLTATSTDRLDASTIESGESLMIVSPNWKGTSPAGVTRQLQAQSELALLIVEAKPKGSQLTQLWKQPQSSYSVQPLTTFLGKAPPPPARSIDYFKPLNRRKEQQSLAFYSELAFVLQFVPPDPIEVAQRNRFAEIGLHAGQPFGTSFLDGEIKSALAAGMAEGQRAVAEDEDAQSGRSQLQKYLQYNSSVMSDMDANWRQRTANENVFTIPIMLDSGGQPFGGQNRYTLTLAAGNLPPAELSWSLAMYQRPQQTRVDNPLHRYRIDSTMLPLLERGSDGSVTIYIQHDPPESETLANWLPAPKGPFLMKLRLHGPRPRTLRAEWQMPPVERVESP
jgi:hypothetical protein